MYNNQFFYSYPNFTTKQTLFSKIKNLNFTVLLNQTQKTLNIINQAIPIVNQIKPLISNTKTIFKIASAINKDDNNNIKQEIKKEDIKKEERVYNQPTFFI